MPAEYSGAHGLEISDDAFEPIKMLDHLGELPGVVIHQPLTLARNDIAGANGEGIGELICVGSDQGVAWKAPGSSRFGPVVVPSGDETHILEDGENPDKWVRATLYDGYRVTGSTARVYLKDRFDNKIGGDDVTAGEAAAGDVSSWTIKLYNKAPATLHQVKVWIDPAVTGLGISDDGASWVSPTTKETALALPDLASLGTDTLHLRRTIVAGAVADPKVLNHLHFAFQRV
jgi:hypothetical protein